MRLYSSCSIQKKSSLKGKRKKRLDSGHSNKTDWQWYDPPEDSAPVHFFLDTSLHGLRYLGQPNRHLSERIFWLVAFVTAVIFSGILIWHMWDNYTRMPTVTVFSLKKTLDKIPFPSVTICSVNNIKKSKWAEYESHLKLGRGSDFLNETLMQSYANALDIHQICKSGKTFTQKFFDYNYIYEEHYENLHNKWEQVKHLVDAPGTLRNTSQSCKEMILFCLWLDEVRNCSDLWSQIMTDYGFCCTFNMIPLSLLRTYVKDHNDDPERVKDWKEANLYPENMILEEGHGERKYPYRQLYAGRSAGLSFLVDANMEEYHCTNADSEGFVVGLNMPLDFPRMRDNGIAVRTGTEVFVGVRPDITISADSARKADFEKRHCFFDGEKKLNHYTKYTASNCLDECIAKETLEECRCLRYYMPRGSNSSKYLCLPEQYNCTENVKAHMIKVGLDKKCDNCWPSCTEIKFHTDVTSLRIRKGHIKELLQYHPNISLHENRTRHASIIHVYYNVDSVFPRLRKEMSTVIDLISDTGGLLGLCMGFSMLSLLEVVYHVTIRLFCNAHRERGNEVEDLQKFNMGKAIDNDEDTHNYGNTNKGIGFLSKVFGRGPQVNDSQSTGMSSWATDSNATRPFYFRTPFEADFQRTFVATRWGQCSSGLNADKGIIDKATRLRSRDFANSDLHY